MITNALSNGDSSFFFLLLFVFFAERKETRSGRVRRLFANYKYDWFEQSK